MSRIIEITVTLKLEIASRLSRTEFYSGLPDLLRSGLGEILSSSSDSVTVVATRDPEATLSRLTNLEPILLPAGEIAIIWSVDDVLRLRPDLTRDEALTVLEYAEVQHDSGDGINWHALDLRAEELFGPALELTEFA